MNKQRWKTAREIALKGSSSPADAARRLLHYSNFISVPIDVRSLIDWLEIELEEIENPGWVGAARHNDKIAKIWIESSQSDHRKRFTMAHELCHIMIHPSNVDYRDSITAGGGEHEIEANKFAAELLIPLRILERCVNTRMSEVELSKQFDVPHHIMITQLKHLSGLAIAW